MSDLPLDLLLHAYASGVFPMAESDTTDEVFWVEPKLRGVFPLDSFHISRSLSRAIRRGDYEVAMNLNFIGVLDACADRQETWINPPIRNAYIGLHRQGFAHSLEIYDQSELIGGVYGVTLGAAFFGESMFSRRRDASKIALAYLVDHLRQTGFTLFDTQFITDHLASLGAIEISRAAYHTQLRDAVDASANWGGADIPTPDTLLKRHNK